MEPKPHEVTRILRSLDLSDREQGERLMALVYDELRELAASHLRRERAGHTLRTTALVHEAYIKLVDSSEVGFANRGHFFGCAARAMRQILVDHAREHGAQKRGGGWERVTLDGDMGEVDPFVAEILDLHRALEKLSGQHEDLAHLVELRFFAGLTLDEAADARGVSRRKAAKDWSVARLWLQRELTRGDAS
ncbi:MAG: ECF-type sigma factor [Longimicrobiales bacterium]